MAGPSEGRSIYPYSPSVPAAVIAVIVFGVLLLVHIFRLFKTRTWFCILFVIGGIFEVIGYASRLLGHWSPDSKPLYIMQTLLILLAPILFAASVYMFLGRIVISTGQASYSMIRPTWLTKIFVAGDILCFLVQAMGASMLTNAESKSTLKAGQNIILGGLILQIIIFGIFILVAVVFHRRVRNVSMTGKVGSEFNWERYLNMLYIVSVIISFRNLFRVIEFAMGPDNYLLKNEWPIYIFDAIPMAVVLGICCIWYVGDIKQAAKNQASTGAFEMIPDTEHGLSPGQRSPLPGEALEDQRLVSEQTYRHD